MYCEGIMWRRRVTNFLSGHREISDVLRTAAVLPVLWGGERGGGCEDSLRICVARSPCCPFREWISREESTGLYAQANQRISHSGPHLRRCSSFLRTSPTEIRRSPLVVVRLQPIFCATAERDRSGSGDLAAPVAMTDAEKSLLYALYSTPTNHHLSLLVMLCLCFLNTRTFVVGDGNRSASGPVQ